MLSSSLVASAPSSGGAKLGRRGSRQLTDGRNSSARKQEDLMASCLARAERIRRLQCTGSHGKQNLPGEAEVWDRGREPAVLPVQLEVSQHGTREGQCLAAWGPPARPVHGKGSWPRSPQGDEFAITRGSAFPGQPLSGAALHAVTGESSDGSSVLSLLCLHRGCPWGKALAACPPGLILLLG